MDMENLNRQLAEVLRAEDRRKEAEKKRDEIARPLCLELAKVIKAICGKNEVCEICPWHGMCGTEPFSWKIPEEDIQNGNQH